MSYFNCGTSKTCNPIDCQSDQWDCDVNNCYLDYCPLDEQFGGGGNIEGYAVLDTFALGGLKAIDVPFGVILEEKGPFEDIGVDGILGLAFEELSSWGGSSVLSYFIQQNKFNNTFGLCLRQDAPVFEIGVVYDQTKFEWTDITQEIWYSVHIDDLLMGGESLGFSSFTLNANGVIVDSGTTWLIISDKKIWEKFTSTLISMCTTTNLIGVCNVTSSKAIYNGYEFQMTIQQASLFPNISIALKGMKDPLTINGQDYVYQDANAPGYYAMGIGFLDDSSIPFIIGDIVLQNYHVAFDLKGSRIGFGSVNSCSSS